MKKIVLLLSLITLHQACSMDPVAPEPVQKKVKPDLSVQEHLTLAFEHKKNGRWQEAVTCFESVMPIATKLTELFQASTNLGLLYGPENPLQTTKDWSKAYYSFKNVLTLLDQFKVENDQQKQFVTNSRYATLRNLTSTCFYTSNHAEAIAYGQETLYMTQQPLIKAHTCRIIGTCFRSTDTESSEKYLRQGLDELERYKKQRDNEPKVATPAQEIEEEGLLCKELAHTLFMVASSTKNCNLEKLSEAETLYTKAISLDSNLKNRSSIWIQLGLIYTKQKNSASAQTCFKLASQDTIKDLNPQAYKFAKIMLTKLTTCQTFC